MSGDQRAIWKLIGALLGGRKSSNISGIYIIDDEQVRDSLVIADKFNHYFVDYPQRLHNDLSPSINDYSHIIPAMDSRL